MDPVVRDLSDALRMSPVASSPGMSSLLARALARSVELHGKGGDGASSFFRQLGKEIGRIRGTAFAETRLECLFLACESLYLYGEAHEALRFSRQGAELARTSGLLANVRRFQTLNGILAAETGDRGLALQAYADSLQLAQQLNDGFGQFAAWNNLSALFVDSGLYEEAIACSREALHVIETSQLSSTEHAGRVHNNIALALYRLGTMRVRLRRRNGHFGDWRSPRRPPRLRVV
jgi:tetratricopeptide (TPR) repeat protein